MPGFDISIPDARYVETEHEARRWLEYYAQSYKANDGLGLDTETTSKDDTINGRVVIWSLSDGRTRICLEEKFLPLFKEHLLENPEVPLDLTNAKYDAHMLANNGVNIVEAGPWRDTVPQSFLLNENNQGRHGLKECVTDHFGRTTPTFEQTFGKVPPKKIDKASGRNMAKQVGDLIREAMADPVRRVAATDYSSLDSYNSTTLRHYFDDQLEAIQIEPGYTLKDYYHSIEVPFSKVLWKMERRGVLVDKGHFREIRGPIEEEMSRIVRNFGQACGRLLNLNSNQKDVPWFFFEYLKKTPNKWTKGGASGVKKPSVDDEVLEEWAGEGDGWARLMRRYREIQKVHGTYVEGIDKRMDPTYRIHTTLNQTGAVTMRLSSKNPNLQNIKRPGEDEFEIRSAFIHGPWKKLLVVDYEQLEMRLMAHFSQDQKMINAIRNNVDLHCLTVAEMYGIPYDDVAAAKKAEKYVKDGRRVEPLTDREKELLFYRQAAKATGFGIIYGIGGPHLASNLTSELGRLVTPEEGVKLINKWFSIFPGVRAYVDAIHDELWKNGKVQTITGRYRRLGDLRSMSKKDAARAQRQGPNSVIQGTARDIITKAMILIDEDKELESLGFEMELQVHDELLGEVPDQKDVIERVKTKVKQYMEHPFSEDLSVPLPVSLGIGDTWMDAK